MSDLSIVKQTEGEAAQETPPPPDLRPLIPDLRWIFQGGLFLLALLTVLYLASDLVLPLVLALVIKLLLQPALRMMTRAHVPRLLAAIVLIGLFFGLVVLFGTAVSDPAAAWAERIVHGIPKLQERLRFLAQPIAAVQQFLHHAERLMQSGAATAPAAGASLSESLVTGTGAFASGFFTTILVLFFLLMAGDTFLRRLVEILPRFRDKRRAVEISQQIETDISMYLVTITVMNAFVGVAAGLAVWACGLPDPLMWGALAFLLNYVPIMGPLTGVVIFLLAGLMTIGPLFQALLPAGLYLLIHMLEGEIVTPMLLARRFTLNPVLVIVSLVFWHWMWGIPGAILAVPMLAIFKILCSRIRPLMRLGHFLEG